MPTPEPAPEIISTANNVGPVQDTQDPIEPADALPGTWEFKVIDSNHTIYASWDTHNQFLTIKGRKSNKSATIKLATGEIKTLPDIWPSNPQVVRIYWPARTMPSEWLYGKPKA